MSAGAERAGARPRTLRAITEAAKAAFLEGGYEGTSLDHIAARAGVSKQTIYNRFGDKAGLFRAICLDLTGDLLASLAPQTRAADPRETLTAFGVACLRLALAESSLALHRLVIQESARFPEFGRAVFEAGPAPLDGALAVYLEEQARAGRLAVPDPAQAADFFMGLLIGRMQLRALLGVEGSPDPEARVRAAVDCFLRAFAPPSR